MSWCITDVMSDGLYELKKKSIRKLIGEVKMRIADNLKFTLLTLQLKG